MALSAQQLTWLKSATANSYGFYSRNSGDTGVGRDGGLDAEIRDDLQEVLETVTGADLGATRAVIHNRNKVLWEPGQDPKLFVSKADGGRVNGWYVGEINTDYSRAFDAKPLPGQVELVHLYEYDFGKDSANSQAIFDRAVRDVEKAILAVKTIAGCRVISIQQQPKSFTVAGDKLAHLYRAFIVLDLCNL